MKNLCNIKIKRLYPDAMIPCKSDPLAAGIDLFVYGIIQHPNYIKISTGIAIQPEKGIYCTIHPRSSIYKRGLIMYNSTGIIDNNYTGELIGFFLKTPDFKDDIQIGDRLMQLIPHVQIDPVIQIVNNLDETERGSGGFGSTGN